MSTIKKFLSVFAILSIFLLLPAMSGAHEAIEADSDQEIIENIIQNLGGQEIDWEKLEKTECSTDPIDYECWCNLDESKIVSQSEMSENMFANYKDSEKAIGLGPNKYLMCFSGSEEKLVPTFLKPFSNIEVNVNSEDELHIYNLYFEVNKFSNPTLQLNNNVILKLFKIVDPASKDSTSIATTPLLILGKNVHIFDSEIHAQDVGVLVKNGADVKITNTKIIGNAAPDSKAIYIEPSSGAAAGNADIAGSALENFAFGAYIGVGGALKLSDSSFTIADISNAIFWEIPGPVVDVTKVGKKIDESGEHATRIAGLAPMCKGSIDTYRLTSDINGTKYISYAFSCPITILSEDDELCFKNIDAKTKYETDEKCEAAGDCECFGAGECVFSCDELYEGMEANVLFSYVDVFNNTHSFSEPKKIIEFDNVKKITPIVSGPAIPVELSAAYSEENDDVYTPNKPMESSDIEQTDSREDNEWDESPVDEPSYTPAPDLDEPPLEETPLSIIRPSMSAGGCSLTPQS